MALKEALQEVLKGACSDPYSVWHRVVNDPDGYQANELNAVQQALALLNSELVDGGDGSITLNLLRDKNFVEELAIAYTRDYVPGM
ncbi:MAG TPA: hypothetical protein VMR81_04390 [Patescibacteria group bacterium]|nr:hypothetical protein [Patescibacteria group bacterium]